MPKYNEKADTPKSFKPGIFVDFSKIDDESIPDEVIKKLKDNLEALLDKNVEEFKAGLLEGHDTEGNMGYILDENQYRFTDIAEAKYFPDNNSIMISLSVQRLREGQVDDGSITYYFNLDKAGEWKIVLID
ncbi:hypothetical protein [Cohnella sp. AR92]|uniref:hypothetical protein n=1 Tax=Cohnella sp. AR92 TaxID=648716 RepID=UPI000F8CE54C|nr:hypothetical protein [Cohnella sp. AR92]RUS45704.1 hypothetical protein ELR57_17715 [Cohnella sp. AR92]